MASGTFHPGRRLWRWLPRRCTRSGGFDNANSSASLGAREYQGGKLDISLVAGSSLATLAARMPRSAPAEETVVAAGGGGAIRRAPPAAAADVRLCASYSVQCTSTHLLFAGGQNSHGLALGWSHVPPRHSFRICASVSRMTLLCWPSVGCVYLEA